MAVGVRAFSAVLSRYDTPGDDEDALTLAADAAVPLAEAHRAKGGAVSGVIFASRAAMEGASLLAAACDVPFERLRTTEVGGPRASVQAMLLGFERLVADRESADVLLAAGATRAAGAALLARGGLCAELLGVHSVTGDDFVAITRAAIAGALTNANAQIRDVARFAIGAPSTPAARTLLGVCGAEASRLAPIPEEAGLAQPLLSFAATLEASAPGDLVVLSAWGGGADALVFRVTAPSRNTAPAAPPDAISVSAPADAEPSLRLRGAKCRHCGATRYPATPLCASCGKEGADSVRLARRGRAVDSASSPDGLASATVELDGGVRVARAAVEPLDAGAPVELCLRRARGGYAWKARRA